MVSLPATGPGGLDVLLSVVREQEPVRGYGVVVLKNLVDCRLGLDDTELAGDESGVEFGKERPAVFGERQGLPAEIGQRHDGHAA